MSHLIPNTNYSHSVQTFCHKSNLGASQTCMSSVAHTLTTSQGKFIAFVSAEAETDNPQSELRPGIDLLGPVDHLFFYMYDRYGPVNEPSLDNCFVSTVSFTVYASYN
ncbi:hypothetical protein GUJ93_ZPchr0010g10595 [Zizania palustris]|uniref:Uncharacterized protein n=1 Tax=Zizania palustris TaxID=103762 RepID=A0A8J5WAC4_ZIZPA|nr:hypothetical protein GUJ93_ZPchr0010g10595 [Zizania palustris]KAG8085595.1 hypothetical protein GUJ93_ZPchr0010g10595 [Zizania palustris]